MTKSELKQTGEALIALSEGKDIEVFKDGIWRDSMHNGTNPVDTLLVPHRIKSAPEKRLITSRELPFLFARRMPDGPVYGGSARLGHQVGATEIDRWATDGEQFSTDGITWKSFWVEE